MAEKLQHKLACDVCGSSDVRLLHFWEWDGRVIIMLICGLEHRTEVRLVRA